MEISRNGDVLKTINTCYGIFIFKKICVKITMKAIDKTGLDQYLWKVI